VSLQKVQNWQKQKFAIKNYQVKLLVSTGTVNFFKVTVVRHENCIRAEPIMMICIFRLPPFAFSLKHYLKKDAAMVNDIVFAAI